MFPTLPIDPAHHAELAAAVELHPGWHVHAYVGWLQPQASYVPPGRPSNQPIPYCRVIRDAEGGWRWDVRCYGVRIADLYDDPPCPDPATALDLAERTAAHITAEQDKT
jgi:hypothetical protein